MTVKRPTLSIKSAPAKRAGARATGDTSKWGGPRKASTPASTPAGAPASKWGGPKTPAARPTPPMPERAPEPAPAALRASYDVKPVLQPGYLPRLKTDSLALCLLGAANAVAQVRSGTTLPQALTTAFGVTQATPSRPCWPRCCAAR